jgi:hypothetical protein
MTINHFSAFKEWMLTQFEHNEFADLCNHGAQNGFSGLTYYSETTVLYNQYHDDIWNMLEEDREAFGMDTCSELIASFHGAKDVGSEEQHKNLLIWYAAERIAFEITQGEYLDEDGEDDGSDDTDE